MTDESKEAPGRFRRFLAEHPAQTARILRILAETPPDASGMVADTPFSKAGVKRLMDMLHKKSAEAGAGGARAAGGLLKLLAPRDGEEAVHGASLRKLQRAGQMAARRRGGRVRDI